MRLTIAGEALKISVREKSILVLMPLLIILFTVGVANLKPRYKAEAKFVVKNSTLPAFDRKALRILGRPMRRLMRAKQRELRADVLTKTATTLAIVQSRVFLSWLIDERQLAKKLLYKQWDEETQSWKSRGGFKRHILVFLGIKGNSHKGINKPGEEQLYDYLAYKILSNGLRLKRDKNSGVVSLSFIWHDPVFSAEIVNAILIDADRYIGQQKRARRLSRLARLNAMLDEPNLPVIRRKVFNEIETLKLELSTGLTQNSGVFDIFDPAYPAEKRAFRLPVMRMIVAGLFTLFCVGVCVLLFKVRRAGRMKESGLK